jgi:CubicO group peptidase (beta-lactamase class C family)
MRYGPTITLLAFGLASASPVLAQQVSTVPTAQIDSIFAEWTEPGSPGGALAIVRDGNVAHRAAYGLASMEYGVPNAPETVFNIGSVSKQFTAYSIMMLARQGRLSIDDDIRIYLPELPDFGETVTIRHMLHHVSGLPSLHDVLELAGWRSDDRRTVDDLFRMAVRFRKLNFPPGSQYLYSNTGFIFLAEIVERLTGEDFNDWTRAHVFEPLGMTNTEFREEYEMVYPNTATSYDGPTRGAFDRAVPFWAYTGSGNVHTTVDDLAKWVLELRAARAGGTLVSQMVRRAVLTSGDTISYAFGLRIVPYRGVTRIRHGGSIGGYRAEIAYFPDHDLGVVLLTNFSGSNPQSKTERVADLLLAGQFAERTAQGRLEAALADTVTALVVELERYVGHYVDRSDKSYRRIRMRDERLYYGTGDRAGERLAALSDGGLLMVNGPGERILRGVPSGAQPSRIQWTVNGRSGDMLERYEPWTPSARDLADYEGAYYSPVLQTTYSLVPEDGHIEVRHQRHAPFNLTPREPNEFSANAEFFGHASFLRDSGGMITGMLVSNGRVKGLLFERK